MKQQHRITEPPPAADACTDVLPPAAIRVISEAARLITLSLDPQLTIGQLLELLSDRMALKKGRVLQADGGDGLLRVRYAYGLTAAETAALVYRVGKGPTGGIMNRGEPVVLSDYRQDEPFLYTNGVNDPLPFIYYAVPILQNEHTTGILAVQSDEQVHETAVILQVLRIIAAMIGQILLIDTLVNRHALQIARDLEAEGPAVTDAGVHGIVGRSPALRRAIDEAAKAASSMATVMLIGESGCGKERFARMIHLASDRREEPFVCINCAAIPPNLLEAELFGHEKGSFTGATNQRKGKFEVASGGTLFLDEIGDMPPDLQAKLLRVLQDRRVQRIGSNDEIDVDVRIICATNKQLEHEIKQGSFRLDLYYRLNVIPIHLPPLRERRGDIELLTLYFLARYNQQQHRNVVFSKVALQHLEGYAWPGNVRQLENVIERLVIMSDSEFVGAEEIERLLETETNFTLEEIGQEDHTAADADQAAGPFRPYNKVNGADREAIIAALRASNGNKTQAARTLGMSPRQLHYRLAKLKIDL